MNKKLNSEAIANELKGKSGFFQKSPSTPSTQSIYIKPDEPDVDTVIPRHHDTMTPHYHDTVIPHTQELVQKVRKAVREIGKEAATHRFTVNEKKALMEIMFHYKQQGITTSENEIARIAINYLIEDFQRHADDSFLAQVIKEINA